MISRTSRSASSSVGDSNSSSAASRCPDGGQAGEYFVGSFLTHKRNEIERFERFVTDWEFREYAYHL
jgi:glutamine synthetase